jgi:hypothetical protein
MENNVSKTISVCNQIINQNGSCHGVHCNDCYSAFGIVRPCDEPQQDSIQSRDSKRHFCEDVLAQTFKDRITELTETVESIRNSEEKSVAPDSILTAATHKRISLMSRIQAESLFSDSDDGSFDMDTEVLRASNEVGRAKSIIILTVLTALTVFGFKAVINLADASNTLIEKIGAVNGK